MSLVALLNASSECIFEFTGCFHSFIESITNYVYMDTFCFHRNEFILIVESERSVYMNAK